MIVILSDTHRTHPPDLTPALHEALAAADCLLHAGDFTTVAVVDAIATEVDAFVGVTGNADTAAVSDRLQTTAKLTHDGLQIAMTHHVDGGEVGRRLFGQAHDASVVVTGHTHQPTVATANSVRLLNPGSHTQPRGGPPTFMTLEVATNHGRVLTTDGRCLEEFPIQPSETERA